jgi:hypothetical protein
VLGTISKSLLPNALLQMIRYVPMNYFKFNFLTFQMFEGPSRTMTGIERMILEAVGFDFRNRCPQPMVIKLAKFYKISQLTGFEAWYVCNDLYRTFTPLKQTTSTMAFACLELATRILDERCEDLENGKEYKRFSTSRDCVMGKSTSPFLSPPLIE